MSDKQIVPVVKSETDILIENMSDFTKARWPALYDGVNIIADKADEKKLDFNDLIIKPGALENYVEGMCDIICRQIKEKKGVINDTETSRTTVS